MGFIKYLKLCLKWWLNTLAHTNFDPIVKDPNRVSGVSGEWVSGECPGHRQPWPPPAQSPPAQLFIKQGFPVDVLADKKA